MASENIVPSIVTFGTMLRTYIAHGDERAETTFNEMKEKFGPKKINLKGYATMIYYYGTKGKLEEAEKVFDEMLEKYVLIFMRLLTLPVASLPTALPIIHYSTYIQRTLKYKNYNRC